MNLKLFHFSEDGKFYKHLDLVKSIKGSPIKLTLFLYDERYDLITILNDYNSEDSRITNFIKLEEDKYKILYECKINSELDINKTKTYFIISKENQIAILMSNLGGEEYKTISGFFYRFYPFINRIFLRSYQILKLLSSIEQKNNFEIIAKNYVAKRYFGKNKTEICHEKMNYKEVFERVNEEILWVDSIFVHLIKDESIKGKIRLNRKGIFSYYNMDFSEVYFNFLETTISYFLDSQLKFLKNKTRTLSDLTPKILKITLTDDIFISKESFYKFSETFYNMVKWNCSIISNKEGFGHLMLKDSSTGSSYDIYVVSTKEIMIIPQTQVTEVSFNKLLSVILDSYEGDLSDVTN